MMMMMMMLASAGAQRPAAYVRGQVDAVRHSRRGTRLPAARHGGHGRSRRGPGARPGPSRTRLRVVVVQTLTDEESSLSARR